VPNLPGDPDTALRDDLAFAGGVLHLLSAPVDFSASLKPASCRVTVTTREILRRLGARRGAIAPR
jgi:hypothetical protein